MPIENDEIDQMLSDALNRKGFKGLEIKRITQGKYHFGTMRINAEIKNQNLIVRVGGGYMSIDEFIESHGE